MFNIQEIMLTRQQIQARVAELGKQIETDYEGKSPLMICILKGSIIFFADLIRQINLNLTIDTMIVSSYGDSMTTSGVLNIVKDLSESLVEQDVIVVEDIIDTGTTMTNLKKHFEKHGINSFKVVSLLDKPSRRRSNFKADYIGFEIPDKFIVGYGLDFAEEYRNLPDICILNNLE